MKKLLMVFTVLVIAATACKKKTEEVPTIFYKVEGVVFDIDSITPVPNSFMELEVNGRKGYFREYPDYNYTMTTNTDETGYFVFYVKELDVAEYTTFSIYSSAGKKYSTSSSVWDLPVNMDLVANIYTVKPAGKVVVKCLINQLKSDTFYYTLTPNIISETIAIEDIGCILIKDNPAYLSSRPLIRANDNLTVVWSFGWENFKRTAIAYSKGDKSDEVLSKVDFCSVTGLPIVDTLFIDGKP
jgi:hypothetical protein